MNKEILNMTVDELRIEVAMLRERCAQLEIRLSKVSQFPPRWWMERPRSNTPNDTWAQPWTPDAPVWTNEDFTKGAKGNV